MEDMVTTVSPSTSPHALVLYPAAKVSMFWDKYIYGVFTVVLGVCGNCLAFILLRRPRLRNSATSFYMTCLAMSDSCVLLFGVAGNHTLQVHGIRINSDVYCKIMYFIVKCCFALSDWTLACMSLERCLAIAMPLKSKSILNPRANKISLFIIFLCVAVYYSHVFVVYGSLRGACRMTSLRFHPHQRSLIDYIIFTLGPAIFIAVSNIIIVISLVRSSRKQLKLSEGQMGQGTTKANTSVIAMLISLSIAFFVLKTPWFVTKTAMAAAWTTKAQYHFIMETEAYYRLLLSIFLWMAYFNHCVNFYLYVLTGREFRQELVVLVLELCAGCSACSHKEDAYSQESVKSNVQSVTPSSTKKVVGEQEDRTQ